MTARSWGFKSPLRHHLTRANALVGAVFGGDRATLAGRTSEDVHEALYGALWNPPGLTAAMVSYAVVANVPCIVVQRSNRGRILRILRRLPDADPDVA